MVEKSAPEHVLWTVEQFKRAFEECSGEDSEAVRQDWERALRIAIEHFRDFYWNGTPMFPEPYIQPLVDLLNALTDIRDGRSVHKALRREGAGPGQPKRGMSGGRVEVEAAAVIDCLAEEGVDPEEAAREVVQILKANKMDERDANYLLGYREKLRRRQAQELELWMFDFVRGVIRGLPKLDRFQQMKNILTRGRSLRCS